MSEIVVVRRTQASVRRAQIEFAATPDLRWAGGASQLSDAVDLLRRTRPALLICDLRLVDSDAVHLLKSMRQSLPAAAIDATRVLTPSADDLLLFHALRIGAHAYVLDQGTPATLVQAATELMADRAAMSPMIARQMLASFGVARAPLKSALQPAQAMQKRAALQLEFEDADRRLLSLLAHGMLAQEVARAWGMATEQVAEQVAQLYVKLHARQPAEASAGSSPS
jgi:DNA-binding NarL/FixJ family response regulator